MSSARTSRTRRCRTTTSSICFHSVSKHRPLLWRWWWRHSSIVAVAALPSFLPGMGFKRKAEGYKKQYYALADRGHRWVENEIVRRSDMIHAVGSVSDREA